MTTKVDKIGYKIAITYGLGIMAAMTVSEAVTELSHIAREFHPANHSLIGLVMTLPSLVVALGALLAGFAVDRLGDRPVLFAGAVTAILGDLGVIFAPSLQVLLGARLVSGVGYVLAVVGSITILMRMTSGKQRTMALALWSTSIPVSFILPFLTAGLAAALGTWRAAFAAHGVLTAILLILGILSLPKPDVSVQVSRTAGLGAVLRSPLPYLLGLSFAAAAFLQSGTVATLGPYLAARYGISELGVHHWNVVAMLANMIGSLLVGRWLNKGVPAYFIGLSGVVLSIATGGLIFGFRIGYPTSIVASWAFTFACGLLVGLWALVPRVAPSPSSMGATSGLVTQLTLIGVLFGAPLSFAAQSSPSAAPEITLLVVAALVCAASGARIWLNASNPQPSVLPDRSATVGAK